LKKTPLVAAAAAAVITAAFYITTLYPAFAGNDSPETISASFNLWLEHAPGYPLHAMLGKIATLMPLGSNAFRVNLLSALLSSITVFLFVLFVGGRDMRGKTAAFFGALVLAFSSTFWSQGIEAKGGIYILNAAMTLVIFFCLDDIGDNKKFFLLAYVFGLSMANSYMSCAALFPAVLYACFKNKRSLLPGMLFFMLGVTPYLYVLIRGAAQLPPRWADTSTLRGFLFLVLRQGYPGLQPFDAGEALFQATQALKGFYDNFSFVILFALPGVWLLFKKNAGLCMSVVTAAALNIILAVFFNSVPRNAPWFITIYLMPAYISAALLIAYGFSWTIGFLKEKRSAVMIAAVPIVLAFSNQGKNDASIDFIDYDFSNNLIMTMGNDPLYLSYGDYFSMPMNYARFAARERSGIRNCDINSLSYPYGLGDLYKLTGVRLENGGELKGNMEKISARAGVYTNLYSGAVADYYIEAPKWEPCGILFKYGAGPAAGWAIFDAYSYRGMIGAGKHYRDFEYPVVSVYPVAMVRAYNVAQKSGEPEKARKFLRMAGAFPGVIIERAR
jgi:hypothetical protein